MHTGGLGLVDGLLECRILPPRDVDGRLLILWSGTHRHKAGAWSGSGVLRVTSWAPGSGGSPMWDPCRPYTHPDTAPRPQCLTLQGTARGRAPGATGMATPRVPASLSWGAILLGIESTLGAGWIRQSA